jgi:hypothetical protein
MYCDAICSRLTASARARDWKLSADRSEKMSCEAHSHSPERSMWRDCNLMITPVHLSLSLSLGEIRLRLRVNYKKEMKSVNNLQSISSFKRPSLSECDLIKRVCLSLAYTYPRASFSIFFSARSSRELREGERRREREMIARGAVCVRVHSDGFTCFQHFPRGTFSSMDYEIE